MGCVVCTVQLKRHEQTHMDFCPFTCPSPSCGKQFKDAQVFQVSSYPITNCYLSCDHTVEADESDCCVCVRVCRGRLMCVRTAVRSSVRWTTVSAASAGLWI